MTTIHPTQSLAGYFAVKATDAFTVKNEDSNVKKYAKLTAGTVAFASLAIVGTVESFVRAFVAALVKTVTFFVPKQYAKKIDEKVVAPLFNHVKITIEHTVKAGASTLTRFMSNQKQLSAKKAIEKKINTSFNSKFMNGVRNIHVNGFRAPEVKLAQPSRFDQVKQSMSNLFGKARNYLKELNAG